MSKVIPITGRHTTLQSMLAVPMADDRAVRGLVVWFEEDGTMHFGELGVRASDVGMALMYIQMIAYQMMENP
jgi:hypothetical protein